ncbi:hypothetical protein [Fodinicurvata sp. EGI_FJ10296]|jgi:hypothetical protein|uniref:hypothetical protein n=1 Tax=Fodinicurvata sp. EGI_FJ10296 TaxID=3231908 RepID=UPI00345577B1
MDPDFGSTEMALFLSIGLLIAIFCAMVVIWLLMLAAAAVFWRSPLPRRTADQIRLAFWILFDTRRTLSGSIDPAIRNKSRG